MAICSGRKAVRLTLKLTSFANLVNEHTCTLFGGVSEFSVHYFSEFDCEKDHFAECSARSRFKSTDSPSQLHLGSKSCRIPSKPRRAQERKLYTGIPVKGDPIFEGQLSAVSMKTPKLAVG